MKAWTEADWKLFDKAVALMGPAVIREYSKLTDKTVLGRFVAKAAIGYVETVKENQNAVFGPQSDEAASK